MADLKETIDKLNQSAEEKAKKKKSKRASKKGNKPKFSEETLAALKIRYNPEAERYQSLEGKKLFIKESEVASRASKLETNKPADATQEKSENEDINKKEISLLERIHAEFLKINESFGSILKNFSEQNQEIEKDQEAKKEPKQPADDGIRDKKKKNFGGIAKAIGFAAFAFAPMLLNELPSAIKYIKEKVQKVKEFLQPAFNFVLEDLPKFFTETIPKFFTDDIPNYFKDKFENISLSFTESIIAVKRAILEIKRSTGESIVSIGKFVKNTLHFEGIGNSIIDFGSGMVSNADKDLKELDKEQAQIDERRVDKELIKSAEAYAEEKKKEDPKKYNDYNVVLDRNTRSFYIEWSPSADKSSTGLNFKEQFDFGKSITKKDIVPLVATKQGQTGSAGEAGKDGASGSAGADGLSGQDGATGQTGAQGLTGSSGQPGTSGQNGSTGQTGTSGLDGKSGAPGPTGADGKSATAIPSTNQSPISAVPVNQVEIGDKINQQTARATDPALDVPQTSKQSSDSVSLINSPRAKNTNQSNKPLDPNFVPSPKLPMNDYLLDQFYHSGRLEGGSYF